MPEQTNIDTEPRPSAEAFAVGLGARIQFRKNGTLARGFPDPESFNKFKSWLEERNYVIIAIESSNCIVYAGPQVGLHA